MTRRPICLVRPQRSSFSAKRRSRFADTQKPPEAGRCFGRFFIGLTDFPVSIGNQCSADTLTHRAGRTTP